MVRRLKKDVLTQLPQKRRQQVFLPATPAEMKQLKGMHGEMEKLREAMHAQGSHGGGGDAASLFSDQKKKINELYTKSGEIKCKAICDYVNVLLECDQKFIIFAYHKAVLDTVESLLRDKNAKFIRIDGTTPSHERSGLVKRFQEQEIVRAAVLSLKAANVGLTLTSASLVVMAEMFWNPGDLIQAEDRAHRIGQACSVNVHYLHMKGSIDDIIWTMINKKLDTLGQCLNGMNDQRLEIEGGKERGKEKGKGKRASGSLGGGNEGQGEGSPGEGSAQALKQTKLSFG